MMKAKAVALALAGVGGLLGAGALSAQQMPEMPAPQTITANVVDTACYINYNLHGADHKMCAEVCAKAGVPLGLLGSDGNLYIASGKGMPSGGQNEVLLPHAEETVRVTGSVLERGGARSIIVDKIESAG